MRKEPKAERTTRKEKVAPTFLCRSFRDTGGLYLYMKAIAYTMKSDSEPRNTCAFAKEF